MLSSTAIVRDIPYLLCVDFLVCHEVVTTAMLAELPAQKQEIEECHQALIEVLDKPERRLVLQIIDAKDRIVEDTSIDSFISGFTLAWKLSAELNNYENERLVSCRTGRLGARFLSRREHHKEETT